MNERKPRKDGRVIKHVDLRVAGTRVRVPLRLRTKRNSYSSKEEFEYAIDIEEPGEVRVHHADPNEVCKLAIAELEKVLSIDWRPMLLVQVSGLEHPYYGHEEGKQKPNEAKLEIEITEYEVGVRGGTAVYRQMEGGYGSVQEGSPIDRQDNKVGVSCAMIPATDLTRTKLRALVTALHDLRNRVADLMRPETIEKTLGDMRVLALPVAANVATMVEPPKSKTVKTRSKR